MTLEHKIEQLTKAVELLTAAMQATPSPHAASLTMAPVATAAPAPVFTPPPVPPVAVAVQQAPVMPAPPVFTPPPVAATHAPAATVVVPFTDGKGLIDYVMKRYRELGAEKGAQIQGVLTSLGYQNINDVKPEHYPAFFDGVEAIK